jgi:hypothetical protein
MAFMGLLTAPILATVLVATPIATKTLVMLAFTVLAVGLMGRLAQLHGHFAKQPRSGRVFRDLVPARVLIALHEPPLRSMTGRRATAPPRAPPSCRHLVGPTAPIFLNSAALIGPLDFVASLRA